MSRPTTPLEESALAYARALGAKPVPYSADMVEARARSLREVAEAVDVANRALCGAAIRFAKEKGIA